MNKNSTNFIKIYYNFLELGLNANEIWFFAIIYSFTTDGKAFYGGYDYIKEHSPINSLAVYKRIKAKLLKLGLIYEAPTTQGKKKAYFTVAGNRLKGAINSGAENTRTLIYLKEYPSTNYKTDKNEITDYLKNLTDFDFEKIIQSITEHKNSGLWSNKKYIPRPVNFLKNEKWKEPPHLEIKTKKTKSNTENNEIENYINTNYKKYLDSE